MNGWIDGWMDGSSYNLTIVWDPVGSVAFGRIRFRIHFRNVEPDPGNIKGIVINSHKDQQKL